MCASIRVVAERAFNGWAERASESASPHAPRVLGFSLEESLCAGVATSGFYVRNAASPTAMELGEFVAKLPPPQQE